MWIVLFLWELLPWRATENVWSNGNFCEVKHILIYICFKVQENSGSQSALWKEVLTPNSGSLQKLGGIECHLNNLNNHQNVLSFNHIWDLCTTQKSERTATNIAPKGPFPANSRPGINKLSVGRNICEGIGVQLSRGMEKSFTNLNLSSFLGENLPESTATGVFVTWHGSSERPALHEVASGFPLWWCSTPPSNCSSCSLWTSWSASNDQSGNTTIKMIFKVLKIFVERAPL